MFKHSFQLGEYTLDAHRQLNRGSTSIPLGQKALELLSILAEADGDLVTKDELFAAVWPDTTVEENTLQAHIVALRKALGPEAARLVTVRGLGYRLALDPARAIRETGEISRFSLAILPFLNLTGDRQFDFLGDSIAEELNNCLSHEPGFSVSAATSCFAYKGHCMDVRDIGRELGVGSIIEGSVRKSDQTMRITAQLIDASTGFHIWSENYDRKTVNLLELEDEVAGSIAAMVASSLAPGS